MTKQIELLSALEQVSNHVLDFQSKLRAEKSPLRKRSNVLKALENLSTEVTVTIDVSKSVKNKPRSLTKQLRSVLHCIDAIHHGILEKELSFNEARTMSGLTLLTRIQRVIESSQTLSKTSALEAKARSNIRERIYAMDELASQASDQKNQESAFVEALKKVTTENDSDDMKDMLRSEMESLQENDVETLELTSQKVLAYKKHEQKLLTKSSADYKRMVETGTSLPTVCPVFVSFSKGRLRESDVLNQLGFKFTNISTRSSNVADVALIIEDQVILQFSKKAAQVFFENKVKAMSKEITSSDISKQLKQKRKSLKATVSKIEKYTATSSKINKKTQALIAERLSELTATAESLERDIEKLEAQIKHKRHKITLLKRELFRTSNLKTQEGKKRKLLNEKAYDQYIGYILGEFHNKGHSYSLLSSKYENHPSISDVLIAWLVPSEVADVVRSLYGDQNIVTSWGLPWKVHV